MVTGKINGQDVTVPAGTTILEAARISGVEVPNLCFQPMLRAWGSCRICTVEILGKRGGLIESCATPMGEGMEVLTHSEPCVEARQYVLQMYLIDHALDCPTCDKSGECYLQDNTYLHNVNANPYRRPKLAHAYVHFSDLIDYKWDRCIMCNRCTRVCDEVIGVTAIEATNRSLEASISPAFGEDLNSTLCTSCGMCIAVCPVGALTDRHFGHHPWELDSTETICGFCDVGCTLNIESNKGIVRRTTHLWERGVNHGYTCNHGRWGHEQVQHPDRVQYPRVRGESGSAYEVTWDDAIDSIAETLAHYQGDQFACLASPDSTNEEVYALQQFTRAVMGTNNIDRHLTPNQVAVEQAVRASLGRDVVNTNNLQELFSDAKSALIVGPDLGKTEPVASYWFYHARTYREAKTVVISQDEYPLCWRSELWLKPSPGTTAILLNGIARQVIEQGLAYASVATEPGFEAWQRSLADFDLATVSRLTGIGPDAVAQAAMLYATGGAGVKGAKDGVFPPALIYQTMAHHGRSDVSDAYGDPGEITTACNNLAALTGNFGRAGGGVASLRGPANYQGATDMGAHPALLPGGTDVGDESARAVLEKAWLTRWAEKAKTSNGFLPVRSLPSGRGVGNGGLIPAIERGEIKAMVIDGAITGRDALLDPALGAALARLEYLVVLDSYDSPLARLAHVVLPKAMSMEKDGTFTNFDRTVQRVRVAVPASGEAKSVLDAISMLSLRMGYGMAYRHPSQVMAEIAALLPEYGGVTYARLERGGLTVPVASFTAEGSPILRPGANGVASLSPRLMPAVALSEVALDVR
ncbi:MAG: molybdopterin-dependent oxidoreductase [Thermomicrobiales bacterium]